MGNKSDCARACGAVGGGVCCGFGQLPL
jgi:hypothetical protein